MDGGDASLPHGDLMNRFCEAMMVRDAAAMADARREIVTSLGEDAMVDAAATIAAFNAYPRAADATGLPLEDKKAELTASLREELGLDALAVAAE